MNGSNTWRNFTLDGYHGPTNATSSTFPLDASGGYHFYRYGISGPTTWHPASGSRYGFSGDPVQVGSYGHQRTSTCEQATGHNIFMTLTSVTVFPYDTAVQTVAFASGTPVRCLRE